MLQVYVLVEGACQKPTKATQVKKNKESKPSSLPPRKVRHRDLTLGKKKEKKEQT